MLRLVSRAFSRANSSRRIAQPTMPLLSADFDSLSFTSQSSARGIVRDFDYLRFCLENRKLKATKRTRLAERRDGLLGRVNSDVLAELQFPFLQNNSEKYIDPSREANLRSFFDVSPDQIVSQVPDLLAELSAVINHPAAGGAEGVCAPLLAKLLKRRQEFLKHSGIILRFDPQVPVGPTTFELINVENFLLVNASPNPLRNRTRGEYFETETQVDDVNVMLLKRKKLQKEAPSFLLSRFLVRCKLGFTLRFTGKTELCIEQPLNSVHFLLLEGGFAEFDYRKYCKSSNATTYLTSKADLEGWSKLKIADIDFCLQGAPFYRVPGLV